MTISNGDDDGLHCFLTIAVRLQFGSRCFRKNGQQCVGNVCGPDWFFSSEQALEILPLEVAAIKQAHGKMLCCGVPHAMIPDDPTVREALS